MRQILQYQKTGELRVEELPTPALKDGGILVQNICSLISAGTEKSSVATAQASIIGKARSRPDLVKQVRDNVKREGVINTYKKVKTRLDNYKELGYSTAGIVIESSVDQFKPGDRVACGGTDYASHAEVIFVPKNLAAKIPDNVSFEEAAFTTVGSIALQGIRQADIRLGENVAVVGLGLIGLITIQLAAASGCRVIGLDISDANFELAKKLGCNECLMSDYASIDSVMGFTRGYGTDAVIITAATKSNMPLELALNLARKKSKIVFVGTVGMNIPKSPFYEKELDLRISCSYGPGRYDPGYEEHGRDYPVAYVRWTENRNMAAILELLAQKRLDVKALISHRFDISKALDAYQIVTGDVREKYIGIVINYPNSFKTSETKKRRIDIATPPIGKPHIQKPTIGFIGAGNFAQSYLIPPLLKLGVRLRGVATTKSVNANSVAKKFKFEYCTTDIEEILNDEYINLVFIATRHDSHADLVKEALKKGKNVFVEKPLAINEQQLKHVIDAYDSGSYNGGRSLLMVGFNRRFSEPLRTCKSFFAHRSESMIIHYRINAGFIPATNWYQGENQGGRIVGEVGHFVDTMQYLTDAKPIKVYAAGIEDHTRKYNSENVAITVSFSDGSVGIITYLANGSKLLNKEYLEIFCEGKTAVMNNFQKVELYEERKKHKKKFPLDKGYFEELRAVLEACKTDRISPISFNSLVDTTRVTFAAVKSIRTGNVIIL